MPGFKWDIRLLFLLLIVHAHHLVMIKYLIHTIDLIKPVFYHLFQSYQTLLESNLIGLPIHELSKAGCLVVVWVTNNSRIESFVKEDLFPTWNVHHLADWIWLKACIPLFSFL